MPTKPTTVYFAGALFNYQELAGNILLAEAIERVSEGRYQMVLPQNGEVASNRGKDIRDNDLAMVAACDLILLNHNGVELDSGTVVEQQFARDLDKPAVVVRTDFRKGGDTADYPYNLMAGYNPRTELLEINAMAELKKAAALLQEVEVKPDNFLLQEVMADSIARQIVPALDSAAQTAPLMPPEHREALIEWAIQKLDVGPVYADSIRKSMQEKQAELLQEPFVEAVALSPRFPAQDYQQAALSVRSGSGQEQQAGKDREVL